MPNYRHRVLDDMLDEYQPLLRALAIHGPKGVGKTATARRRARTTVDLSTPREREIVGSDMSMLLKAPGPVLVDEWQRLPEVWDYIRHAVDDDAPRGHFIVAGSSAPRGVVVHSGAGRIVPVRMRPMSLAERDVESPTVSLAALLDGDRDVEGRTPIRLPEYVHEITASGFPGIRAEPPATRRLALDAYLDSIVQREFPEQGYPVRKPATLKGWLTAYAAATSSTTSYNKILRAATPDEGDKPAKKTTINYRDALSSLWLLDDVPAWAPTRNHLIRLGQASKHHLADPALAAGLLGLDASALLRAEQGAVQVTDDTILGALFEDLVSLSVQVYAPSAEARVYHLRTERGDHEVDLIVQRRDGRVLAIEVKLADRANDEDVKHLHWLRREIGDDLIDAVVVTAGPYAYRRKDGVAVVPAALLGP